jgi:hypothetical protein
VAFSRSPPRSLQWSQPTENSPLTNIWPVKGGLRPINHQFSNH